jgi:paraquat-inducible protein B
MTELVHRGLRVRMETASLITGSKQLTLDYEPSAPPAEVQIDGRDFVLPTLTTGGDDLAAAAGAIMAKLGAIPFEQIGDNLNSALKGMSNLANSQELKQSLSSLQTTLAGIQDLVKRVGNGFDPVLQKLPAMANELDDTLKRINKLVGSADAGYGGASQFNRDADRLLVQLTDTARSVRVLSDLLTRHPEALLRGRTDQGP